MVITDFSIEKINFNQRNLEQVIYKLKKVTNINFECYKREFIERRIRARMFRLNMSSDADYLSYISKNPEEFR